MEFRQVNPAGGEVGRSYENLAEEDVRATLARAAEAFDYWRTEPFHRRADVLRRAAELLRAQAAELAGLMALEMGKPIAEGLGEIEKCAWVCEYYAVHAAGFLAQQRVPTEATRSYVCHEPLGVVFAIMPWNFPFWQVFRFGAPALMAGNGFVLKHAPNVPGCALAIESILREALAHLGEPTALVANLFVSLEQSAEIIASPEVKAVTLTGSTRAGRAVAATAGAALKKVVLELGGSDAYVVLEDADIEAAAAACVTGRMLNAGQSCIAAKRWIVVDAVREAFEAAVLAGLQAHVVGDPFDPSVTVGPMARVDLRDELHDQVVRSVEAGARLVLGGDKPATPGAWYPVSLLTDVTPGMAAFEEELFGPVGVLISATSESHAIELANASNFGLGAAVFTRDTARGEKIAAQELEAGCCFVNTFVRSDPRLPFGGIKDSGHGRELGRLGIHEFVNAKAVYVA